MKKRILYICFIQLNVLLAQLSMNYSYEMKYGVGKQSPIPNDYNYFENVLDVNISYGNSIYIYKQLEYSDLPVFGSYFNGLNKFYLENENENYSLMIGDIYSLYGRGLSFYTYQDQNIDYDNSIRGFQVQAYLNNFEISTLIGKGDYIYRSNPARREADRSIDNKVFLSAINYESSLLGAMQILYLNQNILVNNQTIKSIRGNGTDIGDELENRISIAEILTLNDDDTLKQENININWNYFLGPLDLYIDKAWISYKKIFGEYVFGTRFYTSIYTQIGDIGLTYEYKKYFTPYLLKTISNPPIVYKESSSILASRNSHAINFGNEIGHQIDLNKAISNSINLAANFAVSQKYNTQENKRLSWKKILFMNNDELISDYMPYRQLYMEINGWIYNEKFYYKLGIDNFRYIGEGKNINANTIPTQFVWKNKNGNAVTVYLETQINEDLKMNNSEKNHYLSTSFSFKKWVCTYFLEKQHNIQGWSDWRGIDVSYEITSQTQLSIFGGSQKGGLICANGTCAVQPGFQDGIKITLRSLF